MDEKILCVYKRNLVLVPFDDCESGKYPRFTEEEIITENVGGYCMYGILINDNEFQVVEDSWDGFQPSEKSGVEALKKIKKLVNMI